MGRLWLDLGWLVGSGDQFLTGFHFCLLAATDDPDNAFIAAHVSGIGVQYLDDEYRAAHRNGRSGGADLEGASRAQQAQNTADRTPGEHFQAHAVLSIAGCQLLHLELGVF